MKISEFIKNKVKEAGSQTAVSRKTGVSQGTIAKICNGDTNPEMPTMLKIINAYGISATDIDEMQFYMTGKFKAVADQAALISKDKEEQYISNATGVDLSQMTLEQKLIMIGFKTKDIRQIQEWAKLTEEEQDDELKRLCMQNIEKGRY